MLRNWNTTARRLAETCTLFWSWMRITRFLKFHVHDISQKRYMHNYNVHVNVHKGVTEWFDKYESDVNHKLWPSQSPDPKLTEQLWEILDRCFWMPSPLPSSKTVCTVSCKPPLIRHCHYKACLKTYKLGKISRTPKFKFLQVNTVVKLLCGHLVHSQCVIIKQYIISFFVALSIICWGFQTDSPNWTVTANKGRVMERAGERQKIETEREGGTDR